jgi:branched-chain amino acid transport system substrate-binding protein
LNRAKPLGVRTALTDLSPTPATADYTPDALKVKQSGADGVFAALGIASDVALARAIQQQNVQVKVQLYLASAYESVALSRANAAALNGTYIEDWFAPTELKSTATERYVATLQKYAPGTFGGLIETTAYVYADLAISGMKNVHGAMTPRALAQSIRQITNYTGAGLLPAPLNYSLPKTAAVNLQTCFWFTRVDGGKFRVLDTKPLCGTAS